MYTVKDRNLRTHTYKLEDGEGDTKIVHRNLVLDISFLPVVTSEVESCDAETEEGSSVSDHLVSLEEEDMEDRISAWVMSGSEDIQSQGAPELSDEELSPDDSSQCPPNGQALSHKDNDLNSLVTEPDIDSSFMSDVLSDPPHTQSQPAGPIHDSDTQVHLKDTGPDTDTPLLSSADTEQVVRTRVGRVSKKVNRFIESMVQKPSGFRDFASSVSRKSQSLLTLF